MAGLTALPGAGSAHTGPRLCANVRGGEVIAARNLGCRKARRIVAAWVRRYKRDGETDRRVHGFRCRAMEDRIEGTTVRCRRGHRAVRFYPNVP